MKIKIYRITIMVTIVMTFTVLGAAYANRTHDDPLTPAKERVVRLSGHLVQEKIYLHGDGIFALNLELDAAQKLYDTRPIEKNVDIALVLDRSGSMQGLKMQYAKKAILDLISLLSPGDRLSLVSYSDNVRRHCHLVSLTDRNKSMLRSMVHAIYAGGSTNLGGGLQTGIDNIMQEAQ